MGIINIINIIWEKMIPFSPIFSYQSLKDYQTEFNYTSSELLKALLIWHRKNIKSDIRSVNNYASLVRFMNEQIPNLKPDDSEWETLLQAVNRSNKQSSRAKEARG